jgi:RNA polymerase sigma factor (sigma-70 family)
MSEFTPLKIESLIRQIKEGREEFFNHIDPQMQQIVKIVCSQMHISEYYEEILGSVYEKVVNGFERFEGATWNELKSWLYQIATNATRDFITRTLKKVPPNTAPTLDDQDRFVDNSHASRQENVHDRIDLIRFFETLNPMESFILMLHSSFEYTFDEIARIVKLPSYQARRIYLEITKQFQKYKEKK